jgi:AcrR family transcriptional regulator
MPKVTEAHLKAREEQIILAACKCFSQKGFHQTTMRDICRAARLSPGAVYRYFKGKDAIVEALAEMGRRNTRELLRAMATSDKADEAIAQILTGFLHFFETAEGRQSSRLDVRLWGEAIHTPPLRRLFQRAYRNVSDVFSETVRKGHDAGEISGEVPAEAAALVFGALGLGLTVLNALLPRTDFRQCASVIEALLTGTFAARRSEP